MKSAELSNVFTESDRAQLRKLALDHSQSQALTDLWRTIAQRPDLAERVALHSPHGKPEVILTYGELEAQIRQFAGGLQALGVQPGERIALFADNSPQWLIADQGIMMTGAANVVRSSQADCDELVFILGNSGSTGLVVEDRATLKKLRSHLDDLPLKFVVLLSDEAGSEDTAFNLMPFSQVIALGQERAFQPVPIQHDTLATLLYTSGTTGKPKGVMLTHGNLLHQVVTVGVIVQPQPGDRVLSILPTWHAYERSCEYFLLSQCCSQVYTNLRSVKRDLAEYKPHYMVAVPRLWESIYEGVQKKFRDEPANKQKLINFFLTQSQHYVVAKRTYQNLNLQRFNPSLVERLGAGLSAALRWPIHRLGDVLVYRKVREATGGEIRQVISGGGSLAAHLETFFEIVGVNLLVGYGLTETAPILTARRTWENLRGSAGQPIPGTEIAIVDPESRRSLLKGQRGLVLARGPQVMQGYYQNPEATRKAIDPEGWFDTGDLGMVIGENHLVLTGRAKDTIVLTNGENIEPQPIEDACLRSPYVDQIMLVGQDQRVLGALIVPNVDAIEQWAVGQNVTIHRPDGVLDLTSKALIDLLRGELNREVRNRPGYRPDDRIVPIRLLADPFSMENGLLTQTLKIRRNVVADRYITLIEEMFAD